MLFSFALCAVTASAALALTLPSASPNTLVARDPGQDSRSCLSIRSACDTNTTDPTNVFATPACIALVVCETPKYFIPDFPPNQPRLPRSAWNVVSGGSDVVTQQQFIDFYYGTIASLINSTSTNSTTGNSTNLPNGNPVPVYPTSAQTVINWWQAVVAWTGNCATSGIAYNNFADWIQYVDKPGVCGAVASCDPNVNANAPPCVPQRATDNGSCAEMVSQCAVSIGASTTTAPATSIFTQKYCVLSSFCYSQSTVDVLIKQLVKMDYLYTGQPVLSANQPRLSQAVFNDLARGKSYVSQQDMIDAYYGALTNTIKSCGGPPGAETVCPTGTSGPFPTDASYVIDFWNTVSAWTGFCSTRNIPYQNLADYLQYSSTVKAPTSCS
ncbi:hypothetical protein LshimejAT787_1203750 [Lyophyllum shimeji]|uniref:Secreted protein n=1 Tax=Lyophyllum shimeji TaxID=47721 RepID=A0A9P3UU84_LYOSH|nr:hypothetical protein LshimejAT787_1203750 [Lyophyllum shimeji]